MSLSEQVFVVVVLFLMSLNKEGFEVVGLLLLPGAELGGFGGAELGGFGEGWPYRGREDHGRGEHL